MKVIDQLAISKYVVLTFEEEIPLKPFDALLIDGKVYKPVITYDLPKSIAIETSGDFVGKEVEFVLNRK